MSEAISVVPLNPKVDEAEDAKGAEEMSIPNVPGEARRKSATITPSRDISSTPMAAGSPLEGSIISRHEAPTHIMAQSSTLPPGGSSAPEGSKPRLSLGSILNNSKVQPLDFAADSLRDGVEECIDTLSAKSGEHQMSAPLVRATDGMGERALLGVFPAGTPLQIFVCDCTVLYR